jgi:hypothetical protein
VRGLLCDACGSVHPAGYADDLFLLRLAQLARFGIGAGSGPLLAVTAERD